PSLQRGSAAAIRTPTQPPHIRARSSAGEHYLDMVGVTGSIPVVPTINTPLKQGVSATSSDFGNASSCQNVPRTLPNCLDSLGTSWAISSGFDLAVAHARAT